MKTNIADLKIGCPCGGSTKKIETLWHGITVRAWRCKKCNEEIFHHLDAQKALETVKVKCVFKPSKKLAPFIQLF